MIKIINKYKGKMAVNFEKKILKLLKFVPKKDLIGINEIIITNKAYERKYHLAGGLYIYKRDLNRASIEICIDVIFRQFPKILFYFPFISTFLLANILYHEIGHHCERITHNNKKKDSEEFADLYRKKIIHKAFKLWGYLIFPIFKIFKTLIKLKK